MKIYKKIAVVFFLFFLAGNLFSQEVRVDAVLDTSKLRIGEQAKIDIYVTYSSKQKDIQIEWPNIGDTITGKIEVIGKSTIDTTLPDKTNSSKIFQHQQVLVSVYDSGYYAIPGFKFILNNDTAHPLYTDPLFLEVHTVPTDTSAKNLKDIKAPFNEPFNWKWYLDYVYWGVAILVLLITVIIITSYYARKNKQVVQEPEKPKIPAHITALAYLKKIKEEQIWKEGKVKEYYSSISDTIRNYIEERYSVHALESTTDEIMTAFRSQVIDKESKEKLQQLLTLSDLVKFAKMFPIEDEHNFTLQNAFDFVEGTKREEESTDGSQQIDYNSEEVLNQILKVNATAPDAVKSFTPSFKSNLRTSNKPYTNEKENELREQRLAAGKKRFKKVVIIGSCVLLALIALFVVKKVVFPSANDNGVGGIVNSINMMCPVQVNSEMRLDNVTQTGDETVQFNCTLVNVQADQVDVNAVRSMLEPAILEEVRSNPQLEKLRTAQLTLKYSYNDRAGSFLFSFKITPQDYNTYN